MKYILRDAYICEIYSSGSFLESSLYDNQTRYLRATE